MNPLATIAVALALLGGCYGAGRWQQYATDKAKRTAELLAQTQAARDTEAGWQTKLKGVQDAKNKELRGVAAERDAALRGLRDRAPNRLPPASTAACAGASGRELSHPDAEFLIGLAARADEQRAALIACQAREQALVRAE